MFDAGVKSAAAGPDRPALTEGSTGVVRGAVHATASPLRIDGIGDQSGKIALVATTFGLTVKASTPAGPLTITRLTELTFANEFGKWRVTAYKVVVRRRVGATDHVEDAPPPADRDRSRTMKTSSDAPRSRPARSPLVATRARCHVAVPGELRRVAGGLPAAAGVGRDLPARREARTRGARQPSGRPERTVLRAAGRQRLAAGRRRRAAATRCTSSASTPSMHKATMLDIPRDTCWTGDKINAANAEGGPAHRPTAVGGLVGVPVGYAVDVDFAGFTSLVDGVGGLNMNVPDADARHVLGCVLRSRAAAHERRSRARVLARPPRLPAERHHPDGQPGPADPRRRSSSCSSKMQLAPRASST